jgi:hypothetical protein
MIIPDMYIDFYEDDKIYFENKTTVQLTKKGNTMKNINSRALSLAHEIKSAYSSFRLALLVAYKVLKDSKVKEKVLKGLLDAQIALASLKMPKWQAMLAAWLAIYNLDYLD